MKNTNNIADHRVEINEMIKRRNVSRKAIADSTGISQTYLYNYLNGHSTMSATNIRKVCEFLGMDYVGKTNFESKKGEQWKPIGGIYEGLYLISTLGRVYSCKTDKILTMPRYNGSNRVPFATLKGPDGKNTAISLTKLMIETFKPECKDSAIYHLNGDKSDNRLVNLAVEAPPESLTNIHKMGTGRKNAVKNIETGIVFPSIQHAAEALGLSYYLISKHLKLRKETGMAPPVNGFTFEPATRAEATRFVATEEQQKQLKTIKK